MKRVLSSVGVLIILIAVSLPRTAEAQGARLRLDGLTRLADAASNVTDIGLDPAMLQLAGNFLSSQNESTAPAKQLLSGLTGVYVKSFEFDRDNAYSPSDIEGIRSQFKTSPTPANPLTGAWHRVLVTEEKKNGELVEIYMWREGERTGGVAILVAEPRELTVVNLVGDIDLAKLAALQGQFGIPAVPVR